MLDKQPEFLGAQWAISGVYLGNGKEDYTIVDEFVEGTCLAQILQSCCESAASTWLVDSVRTGHQK